MLRILRTAAVVLACLALAFPVEAQTSGGSLAVGQLAEPRSLDPQSATATNDFRIVANIYDGLVRYKSGTLEVEPALATEWTISQDGLSYSFGLRAGVTFHDGTPFDAESVKFTFDRMLDPDFPERGSGAFPLAFFFSAIDAVKVVDSLTVEFRLKQPFAPFLSNLAHPAALIVSPTAVREDGDDFGRNPVGAGPFAFKEWTEDGEVVLVGNQKYWDGAPKLAKVSFLPIPDADSRVAALTSGKLDLMLEAPPEHLVGLRANPGYRISEQVGPHLWFLILNTAKAPFSDKRVRQAVNYAINKERIVREVLNGAAEVAAGPIPPAFGWASDSAIQPYPYDPREARRLIAEAGMEGAAVTFYVAENGPGMLSPVPMATAIQADLAAVGLKARIETYEWGDLLSRVNAGLKPSTDLAEMAWIVNDPDTLPYLALRTDATPDEGGLNAGYYSNPAVDDLIEKARRTSNRDERGRLYKEIGKIVHEDAPWVFVANMKQNSVASAAVEGFRLEPTYLFNLAGVTKE